MNEHGLRQMTLFERLIIKVSPSHRKRYEDGLKKHIKELFKDVDLSGLAVNKDTNKFELRR